MRFKVLVLAVFLLGAVSVASADNLTINNGGSITMGGVSVGPYNFTDNTTGKTLELVCDTFANEVFPPESWDVTISSSLSAMSYANPPGTPAQVAVEEQEVAWLAQQILLIYKNPANAELVGQMQWAIWKIFDPTDVLASSWYSSISATDKSGINAEILAAQNNYASGNYSNIMIYTPVPGTQRPSTDGPPQQYLGDPVPEPGVLLLVAMGLCSLVAFRRRIALA
jgi:hypothetical protein